MPFAAGILLGLASYASRKIVGAGLDLSPMKPELGRKKQHILGERVEGQRRSHRGTRIGPLGLIGPIGSMLGRSEDASAA